MKTRKELKQWLENWLEERPWDGWSKRILMKKGNIIENITMLTQNLSNNESIQEQIYHIVNDLKSVPKCPICEKLNKKFYNYSHGYNCTCSGKKCSIQNRDNKRIKIDHIARHNKIMSEKYPDDILPTCRICGQNRRMLQSHITQKHGIDIEDYLKEYNLDRDDLSSIGYKKQLSDRISGEKNPWYNHGGNLSPFSLTKYINLGYSEKEAQELVNKTFDLVKQTKSDNPQNQPLKIEYYLKQGYNEEEALTMLKDRQTTFSLKKCILKYGKEKGTLIFRERQEKWQNTLKSKPQEEINEINKKKAVTKEMLIEKYGEEKAKEILESKYKHNNGGVSKISQELFYEIYEKIQYKFKDINFGNLSKEKCLFSLYENQYVLVDFHIEDNKKIIEFNGDYWHANPKIYDEDSVLNFYNNKIKASEIWKKDLKRNKIIEDNGYQLLTIWENDYRYNKEETIDKCLRFINER